MRSKKLINKILFIMLLLLGSLGINHVQATNEKVELTPPCINSTIDIPVTMSSKESGSGFGFVITGNDEVIHETKGIEFGEEGYTYRTTIKNLPEFDEFGNFIQYDLESINKPGFVTGIGGGTEGFNVVYAKMTIPQSGGGVLDGYTPPNLTHEISVSISKGFSLVDNAVAVLYKDKEILEKASLSKENDFSHTFIADLTNRDEDKSKYRVELEGIDTQKLTYRKSTPYENLYHSSYEVSQKATEKHCSLTPDEETPKPPNEGDGEAPNPPDLGGGGY